MKVWMTGSKRWQREKSFIRRHFFLSTHSLATFFQATHKSGRSTRKSLSSISSLFPFLSLQLSQFSYWFASVQPLPFFLQLSSIYLGAIAREILLTRYNVMIWVSVVEVIWIIPQRNPHFLKEFLEVVTSSIISVESKWNVRIPEERYNEIVHQTSM